MTFPEPFLNENDETLFIGLIVSGVLMVAVAGLVLYNLLKQKHPDDEEPPNDSHTEKKEDTKEKPDNKIQSKTHHVPTAHDGVDDDKYIGTKEEDSQEKSAKNEDQPSANNSDKKEEEPSGENKDQPPGNKVESTDKGVGQDGNDKFLLIGYIIVGVIVVAVLYDIFILKYYFQLFWKIVKIL